MARGHEEETIEQAVNPNLLLRAMQTAIAQGLRARNEPPEELPPELTVLLERLKEQWQEWVPQQWTGGHGERPQIQDRPVSELSRA